MLTIEAYRHRAEAEIPKRSIDISRAYGRVGQSSGISPPDEIDERIELRIPERIVRKSPFKVDLVFHNEQSTYIRGSTKRAHLVDAANLALIADTHCPGVPTDGSLACVIATEAVKTLSTGWRIQAGDQERLDIILDLTQSDDILEHKNVLSLTDDEFDRLHSDEQTRISVTSGGSRIELLKIAGSKRRRNNSALRAEAYRNREHSSG